MEHLVDATELEKIQASIPKTPWLDFDHDKTREYRLGPFDEYPLQRGWTAEQLHSLRLGGFKDTDPASALAMLQSWLFFGLLESAFQERFPSRSFIFETDAKTDTGDCRVLNTAYLRTYYQHWHLDFLNLPDERKASLSRSFSQSLHGPRDWALFLTVKLGPRTPEYNTPSLSTALNSTIRTTLLLMELLGKATPQSFPRNAFVNQQMDLDPGGEISQWMRERKWCPSSYKVLMNKYGPSVAMYATLLEPAQNSFVSHDRCESGSCVAFNVDVSTYEPRHMSEGCSCEKIYPPIEDVYKALQSGTFPLLDGEAMLNDDPEGRLVVTPHESGTEFLAFSHVWSDGLGSVTEKGLPRCQVAYLSRLTRVISGSTLFWIDGLCIPKDPATRTAALHIMASTFNSASITLVLDAGMRKCSIERPLEEVILRILSSVWMRRLWTMQEGALAGRLVFLLKDYFFDLNDLLARIFSAGFSGPISAAALGDLVGFNRKLYATKPAHINHIQRLTGYRTSSRLDDETLAIAPLFHIDVKRLTPHMGERRKMEFWNCLRKVPKGIIFSDASRLTTRGYRWAPNTLMHGDANIFGPEEGKVTSEGMVGEFMLLELENQLRVEVNKTFQLLDVVQRKAFRLFDQRDIGPDDQDQNQNQSSVCDAIAIRQQPTGELIPGVAIFLVRDGRLEDEDEGVVGYEYGGKLMIVMDEFVELVFWEDLPGDAIIVRSGTRKIRIS
jgi:hypothetical protein